MILALLQARVSSSRLPGKVLLPLLGKPMIQRQIERIRRARRIDAVVLAASLDASDDALAAWGASESVTVFRGSLHDVLDRFYQAALPYQPDWVLRLTGDCPLADPELIDRVITETLAAGADYGSNALQPSFPDGLDAELVRFSVLGQVWREAVSPAEREHVTLAVHRHPERFKLHSVTGAPDLSHLRWTVDEQRDFEFVTRIYEMLYPLNPAFTTADILRLLDEKPELAAINSDIMRNQGLANSLARETPAAVPGRSPTS